MILEKMATSKKRAVDRFRDQGVTIRNDIEIMGRGIDHPHELDCGCDVEGTAGVTNEDEILLGDLDTGVFEQRGFPTGVNTLDYYERHGQPSEQPFIFYAELRMLSRMYALVKFSTQQQKNGARIAASAEVEGVYDQA